MADVSLIFTIVWDGMYAVVGNPVLFGLLIMGFFAYGLAAMRAPAILWLAIGTPLILILTSAGIYAVVEPLIGPDLTLLLLIGFTILTFMFITKTFSSR